MTEKMKFETKDLIQENIAKIGQLFPEVLTEAKDDNGILKKAIDFDKLRQILSDKAIDNRETYDFTWVGKKQAILEAATSIRKTLRPCKEESVNWDTTQNLYIEGDNLDVLKLLQDCYANQVKMIYIDPPYNTGNDVFVYNDDFRVERDEYEEQAQIRDEEGYKMRTNKNTSGRFHSEWCSMMYPRLKLARNLLTDDGVIFISIDDREVDNLRKICDEVFGSENFIGIICWECRNPNVDLISSDHEYCIAYARNQGNISACYIKSHKVPYSWYGREIGRKYDNLGQRYLAKSTVTPRKAHYTYYIVPGVGEDPTQGAQVIECTYEDIEKLDKTKYVGHKYYAESPNTARANLTNHKYKLEKIKNIWRIQEIIKKEEDTSSAALVSVIHRKDSKYDDANKDLKDINFEVFPYAKPVKYVENYVKAIFPKDCTILDFFSGSATTAHAVMKLNAEDGGNRKFIMVQLPEPCDEKSEAYKAGYKNICEIGKERIRRAAKQIKGEHPESNFDGGFRVFKLAESNMKEVYFSPSEYKQDLLSQMTSNIKEDRNDMDLLYGCMLEWGLPLSYPHTSEKVGSYTIHNVNNGALMACFDENIPEDIIRHMAAKKPRGVVFRDAGFADSPAKINVGELFKLLSPDTEVKVI